MVQAFGGEVVQEGHPGIHALLWTKIELGQGRALSRPKSGVGPAPLRAR